MITTKKKVRKHYHYILKMPTFKGLIFQAINFKKKLITRIFLFHSNQSGEENNGT